jgi:hypothetical protein
MFVYLNLMHCRKTWESIESLWTEMIHWWLHLCRIVTKCSYPDNRCFRLRVQHLYRLILEVLCENILNVALIGFLIKQLRYWLFLYFSDWLVTAWHVHLLNYNFTVIVLLAVIVCDFWNWLTQFIHHFTGLAIWQFNCLDLQRGWLIA